MYYIVQLYMEKKSSVCTLFILQKVVIYGKAREREEYRGWNICQKILDLWAIG